jgi:hypothetical protein
VDGPSRLQSFGPPAALEISALALSSRKGWRVGFFYCIFRGCFCCGCGCRCFYCSFCSFCCCGSLCCDSFGLQRHCTHWGCRRFAIRVLRAPTRSLSHPPNHVHLSCSIKAGIGLLLSLALLRLAFTSVLSCSILAQSMLLMALATTDDGWSATSGEVSRHSR